MKLVARDREHVPDFRLYIPDFVPTAAFPWIIVMATDRLPVRPLYFRAYVRKTGFGWWSRPIDFFSPFIEFRSLSSSQGNTELANRSSRAVSPMRYWWRVFGFFLWLDNLHSRRIILGNKFHLWAFLRNCSKYLISNKNCVAGQNLTLMFLLYEILNISKRR